MNQKNTLRIGLLLLFVLAAASCEKNPVQTESMRVYTVTLNTVSSSPVSNATLSLRAGDKQYVVATDQNGKADLTIPNDVELPPFAIITADHASIMPEARTFSGAINTNARRTITCEPAPSRVLVREVNLHHIGDDHYSGDPNSQLQIPAQGVRLSFAFNLSGIPNRMPNIRFYARGIQRRTQIKINNITVDYLGNSSADGDLILYSFQLTANPSTVLRVGTNVLTIETVYYEANVDWDDLEFCSLLLYYP